MVSERPTEDLYWSQGSQQGSVTQSLPEYRGLLPDLDNVKEYSQSSMPIMDFGMSSWMSPRLVWQPSIHRTDDSDGSAFPLGSTLHQRCTSSARTRLGGSQRSLKYRRWHFGCRCCVHTWWGHGGSRPKCQHIPGKVPRKESEAEQLGTFSQVLVCCLAQAR